MENIPRVLTNKLGVNLDAEKWSIPPVYGWLAAFGKNKKKLQTTKINNCVFFKVILMKMNC